MKKTTLKDYLSEILNSEELSLVNRSFEIVGDIAICEIPNGLEKYDKEIGEALLKVNKSIKVVLKKSGIHKGEFRTQDLIHIAGVDRKETIYRENGILLKINPETVYFSSKLSTEREKLMEKLKPNKRVLVMFSGSGPYSLVALRKQPNLALIDSIEINPEGHKYALENLKLNKNIIKKSEEYINIISKLKEEKKYINEKEIIDSLINKKIHFYNGDVREIIDRELKNKKYDEIFMPLPKDAELFLDCAFKVADKNAIIHMYDFLHENEFPKKSENAIKDTAKKFEKEIKIIETRKVGQYSPRKFRVCCDFIVK